MQLFVRILTNQSAKSMCKGQVDGCVVPSLFLRFCFGDKWHPVPRKVRPLCEPTKFMKKIQAFLNHWCPNHHLQFLLSVSNASLNRRWTVAGSKHRLISNDVEFQMAHRLQQPQFGPQTACRMLILRSWHVWRDNVSTLTSCSTPWHINASYGQTAPRSSSTGHILQQKHFRTPEMEIQGRFMIQGLNIIWPSYLPRVRSILRFRQVIPLWQHFQQTKTLPVWCQTICQQHGVVDV